MFLWKTQCHGRSRVVLVSISQFLPFTTGNIHIYEGQICADQLTSHQDEYAPFCEYTDAVSSFDQYVDRVRSSSEWGGHLELRALSEGLKRPIVVYSASQPKLVLGEDYLSQPGSPKNGEDASSDATDGDDDGSHAPILLSYHLHYYTLGEHYNQVVPEEGAAAAADELQAYYQD